MRVAAVALFILALVVSSAEAGGHGRQVQQTETVKIQKQFIKSEVQFVPVRKDTLVTQTEFVRVQRQAAPAFHCDPVGTGVSVQTNVFRRGLFRRR